MSSVAEESSIDSGVFKLCLFAFTCPHIYPRTHTQAEFTTSVYLYHIA